MEYKDIDIDIVEDKIGYKFKNKKLLIEAITHKSYANENPEFININYERLEFLGDSLLGFVVSHFLFFHKLHLKEGIMSTDKSKMVCEDTLASICNKLDLGKHILMAKGTILTGGYKNKSILADIMESITAAIYLDSDLENAMLFLEKNILRHFEDLNITLDSKSKLQQMVAECGKIVNYKTISQKGPDHKKEFEVAVYIDDVMVDKAVGFSKKEAQMNAAQKAIVKLDKIKENSECI